MRIPHTHFFPKPSWSQSGSSFLFLHTERGKTLPLFFNFPLPIPLQLSDFVIDMEAFEEMIGEIESDNPFGFYSCNLRSHTCSLSDRNWIIKMIIGKRSSSEKLAKRYHFRARSIRRWVQQARKTGYVTVRGGRPPLLDPVSITCAGIWGRIVVRGAQHSSQTYWTICNWRIVEYVCSRCEKNTQRALGNFWRPKKSQKTAQGKIFHPLKPLFEWVFGTK